jgi:hypothetical protein
VPAHAAPLRLPASPACASVAAGLTWPPRAFRASLRPRAALKESTVHVRDGRQVTIAISGRSPSPARWPTRSRTAGTRPTHSTSCARRCPSRAMAPTRGGMPGWLEDVLIAAGVLVATAFAAEPARRRRAAPGAAPGVPGRNPKPGRAVRAAAKKARIILADHERLVVTYCARDHTVYVLTPPGEDPPGRPRRVATPLSCSRPAQVA